MPESQCPGRGCAVIASKSMPLCFARTGASIDPGSATRGLGAGAIGEGRSPGGASWFHICPVAQDHSVGAIAIARHAGRSGNSRLTCIIWSASLRWGPGPLDGNLAGVPSLHVQQPSNVLPIPPLSPPPVLSVQFMPRVLNVDIIETLVITTLQIQFSGPTPSRQVSLQ